MKKLSAYCIAAAVFLLFTASGVLAQDQKPKFEVGVHYTMLFVDEKDDHDSGPGIRFTYNANDYVGFEAETSYLPQTREGRGNNAVQGFFGARAGIRKKRFGLFAKARPGFTAFYMLGVTPGPNEFEKGHTRFALDVGGVFEYYPTKNIAVRVDAGDTMIHFKPGDFFYQRLDEPMFVSRQLSHNFQLSMGVAYRF